MIGIMGANLVAIMLAAGLESRARRHDRLKSHLSSRAMIQPVRAPLPSAQAPVLFVCRCYP